MSYKKKQTGKQVDVYQKVTDRIIKELEQGRIPWENPVICDMRPQNAITGHIYKGINPMLVSGSKSPYFMTFKQARSIGANVKKGAESFFITFWKSYEKKKTSDKGVVEKEMIFILKYYSVFQLEDIENIPEKFLKDLELKDNQMNKEADQIVKGFKDCPQIVEDYGTPSYTPMSDTVGIPNIGAFNSTEEYYSTLFHELSHSTMHESRLNRKSEQKSIRFGSTDYAKEELIAEMGASFLMAEAGLSLNIKNRVAYIGSWLKKLKDDKKLLVQAGGKAQKSTEYILGI